VSYIAHVEAVLNCNQFLVKMKIIVFYSSWRLFKVSYIAHVEVVLKFNQILIKIKIITCLHHAFYKSWRLFKVSYIAHVEAIQSVIHFTCGGYFKF
jgi:hypothetical protein